MDKDMESFIGKQLVANLFNDKGVFVLPALTLLSAEHIRLIRQHKITLESHDVVQLDSAEFFQLAIDDCTAAIENIFEQIRHNKNKRIPMLEVRNEVIPFIQQVSEKNDFYGVLAALQTKDDYTYRHNVAVGIISTLLGKWLKLKSEDLSMLTIAATLHDIGKMRIPDDILTKPGPLSDEEFQLMKKHTTFGYEMIRDTVGTNHTQALVALQHHERMDGSGYPFGVLGNRITDFSKIVAVADVFHAMTSDRFYRKAAPLYEVLLQMEESVFGKLDPYICRVFINKLMQSMLGNEVELTDGRKGKIVMILATDPLRPLVNIDEDFIDLSKHRSLGIVRVIPQ
ncbi:MULTISPECIES: HD-GYP domain-containing protein [Paenibacillus]|jgi:putative nucleotidyltransferase with HDIG domain|uniref:HD-GYP domain-containing protein n=2 Tax=Paenibacillus odorifer TaxID=189426 RepID=A0AAD0KJ23_9BACL|nr:MULTISPECIES: HD-GYP domain-containing protein [Paenibacillus]AWV34149.1 HD-GYP domain-containing protein [Paenibacillus odorifer]ETT46563.1 metal dependent phosphohydrolase [Paenibacillus sp. FSL H8-237]MDH6428422.1 putative nucleotidyltransferase with HDIG domain [Paenibacillus sp. PastH-4]MDH6443944.1 putative nucleotidyltransferase with HDIG domain [Paenibacillus sp. PastF-4]MDH6527849.1 putative nucleotidyltransferase with HDIG domain [Paenibacillus sp. PastH-3]